MTKIAIVAEDAWMKAGLVKHLSRQFSVATFSDVPAFIDYVTYNRQLAAVFVDLTLPDIHGVTWELGGLSVIQKLRHTLGEDAPQLCVFTGVDQIVHINTCLKNGADAFVEKVPDMASMAARIEMIAGEELTQRPTSLDWYQLQTRAQAR